MSNYRGWITQVSESFANFLLNGILIRDGVLNEGVHIQYPADDQGVHVAEFLNIEKGNDGAAFRFIASDMLEWVEQNYFKFDVIFAPNQPAVRKIVREFVHETTAEIRTAFWEYLPTGRFGNKLVSGEIKPGDRVLVYNAVSIQGRCIGERLPSFVEALGGEVVAIACFAKGTAPKVRELEEKWGDKFYSAIQIDIPVYKPEDCPMCKAGEKVIPWTEL